MFQVSGSGFCVPGSGFSGLGFCVRGCLCFAVQVFVFAIRVSFSGLFVFRGSGFRVRD